MFQILAAGLASMLITLFLGPKFIAFLRRNEFGQQIREEGPQEHHKTKKGIPTLGGLLIMIGMTVPFIILSERSVAGMLVLLTTLGCAAIGFADDLAKIRMKRSLGLKARGKVSLQLVLAVIVGLVAVHYGHLEETIKVPLSDSVINAGLAYYFIIFLVIVGTSNAVNLTDGLDGLAAGAVTVIMLTYTAIAFITGQADLAIISACIGGACVGFLWFNSFPAEVFMGDTGSLGLGGAIAALAVLTKTEILLVIIGGIFVAEALSVIIQVVSFKTFKKRVFLMTPIHHHFELSGWTETQVVGAFYLINTLLILLAYCFS
jgi:phospho-N-acetylmuramoyl-pentapeptide-transferase